MVFLFHPRLVPDSIGRDIKYSIKVANQVMPSVWRLRALEPARFVDVLFLAPKGIALPKTELGAI